MGQQAEQEQPAFRDMSPTQHQSMQETQESMLLLVYNPHSVKTYHYVCMPANSLHYSIRDFNDEEVEYQLVPLPAAVINLPGRSSSAIQQLCFEAESIPPLGYTSFYISSMQDRLAENEYAKKFNGKQETDQDVSPIIYNEFIKVTVNKDTGLLESISHVDGVKVNVAQNFYYYDQASQAHQSGAYSFRPGKNRPTPVALKVTYHTIRGILVKEIRQRFADWITQIIRLYRGEEFVEVEWVVGPVPIGTDLGKEVVSIFSTNVSSGGTFFTDSNGRQMAQRTCWNQTTSQQQKKPVAACYYPVTSRICIQSQNASVAMCVLTDRTQGGTSYNEGEIELMVHRRLLTDDGFGLEEPLNEEAYGVGLVVKGTHRIMFGNYKQDVDEMSWEGRVSALSRRWRLQPWISVTSADKVSRRRWQNVRNKRYSLLRPRGLPRHVHILTLEPWKGGAVLLRLENTQEKPNRGPKPDKSENGKQPPIKPSHVTVQLRQLFVKLRIKMVRETTLAANQWLDDARQMDWSTRYVYNGADDDILAEDNIEYRDEAKVTKEAESKDTGDTVTVDITNYTIFQGRYSDEDEYTQTKPAKRPTHHMTSKDGKRITYDRKKRSAIPTVQSVIANVNENILNATFVEEKVNISTEIYRNTTTDVPILYINMSTTDKITRLTTKARHQPVTKGMARKILNSEWAKPARFFANLQIDNTSSSEEIASDEDISMNIKKRSSKKRNETVKKKKQETAIPEVSTSDDGITRSIFDMYYRPFTRLPTFTASVEYEGVPKTRIRDHKSRRFNNNEDLARGTAVSPGYSDRAAEERFKNNDDELARGTAVSPGYGDRATADRWRPYNKVINGESYSRRRSRHREKARERVKTDEKVYEDSGQLTERSRGQQRYGSKTFRAHVPFYPMNERDVRNKKRIQRAYSDSNEDEDMYTAWKVPARARDTMDERRDDFPEEADDDQDDDTDRTWRQKRATGEDPPITDGASQEPEQADQSEPDYIITLRPTQIRTFVIWFEPAKSPYVM